MPKQTLVAQKKFGRGVTRVDFAVPPDANSLDAYLPRINWRDTGETVVRMRFLYSGDGGATWPSATNWSTYPGHSEPTRQGLDRSEHHMHSLIAYNPDGSAPIPLEHDPTNPNRRIAIEVDALEPIDTAIHAELKIKRINFKAMEDKLNKK